MTDDTIAREIQAATRLRVEGKTVSEISEHLGISKSTTCRRLKDVSRPNALSDADKDLFGLLYKTGNSLRSIAVQFGVDRGSIGRIFPKEKRCVVCYLSFRPSKFSHVACSNDCRAENRRKRQRIRNKRNYRGSRKSRPYQRVPTSSTNCCVCGSPFLTNNKRVVCCSDECRETRRRQRERIHKQIRDDTSLTKIRDKRKIIEIALHMEFGRSMKICEDCRYPKDARDFYGAAYICITCSKERNKKWRRDNPDTYKTQVKRYRRRHPEALRRRHQRIRDELRDSYVAESLSLPVDIARPIIPAKREQLRNLRIAKNVEK